MLTLFRDQPRAFYMIFMLEIWERFGFYTVQGVLTLFFMRYLGTNDQEAYYIFGAFSALVYGMVPLGGYLGDKILGTKRMILLGLIILALGYLALSLLAREQIYLALGLICVGNGLFKANPSSLLAKCYESEDPRLPSGFTLYYMAVNLGSIAALLLGPSIASHYGYSYAYFISFIGLTLGLANYCLQYQHIALFNTEADLQAIYLRQWLLIVLGILGMTLASAFLLQHVFWAEKLVWLAILFTVPLYFFYMSKENKASCLRMLVAFILMIEAIVFFTLYQQMPTSLNLFAVNNVIPSLLGMPLDPQSFQALNPIWIIIMSPLLAMFYHQLYKRNIYISVPYKFVAGMFCCGFGFCLLYFVRYAANDEGMVSSWWLVASYFFQSIGELLVSALGVAMVAELSPRPIWGFVMGMWFLTTSLSGFIGATVASFTALPEQVKPGIESLAIYSQTFAYIGLVTLILGGFMGVISPKLSQIINASNTFKKRS